VQRRVVQGIEEEVLLLLLLLLLRHLGSAHTVSNKTDLDERALRVPGFEVL
jgi:hypothetical protein